VPEQNLVHYFTQSIINHQKPIPTGKIFKNLCFLKHMENNYENFAVFTYITIWWSCDNLNIRNNWFLHCRHELTEIVIYR